jgi:hypothetical protein
MPTLFSVDKKPVLPKPRGTALDIKVEASCQKEEVLILPGAGDLSTDGMSEAMNEMMEEFGKERLSAFVQRAGGSSASVIEKNLRAVNSTMCDPLQGNDMTFVFSRRAMSSVVPHLNGPGRARWCGQAMRFEW